MRSVLWFLAVVSYVVALPRSPQKIVGGTAAQISSYPFTAAMLYSSSGSTYGQACGGSVLTTTAVLSAAHCYYGDAVSRWRVRVGSSNANSGGAVHTLRAITIHSQYNTWTSDNDVAVLRTAAAISYSPTVQPATIAGGNYALPDNSTVWAVGWGALQSGGPQSEQLQKVQVWTVAQAVCRARYAELGWSVTDNMLCSGWLDVGGRDQCQGDSGGPLIHNNVIVGLCSWGYMCAVPRYPGVNTRVSKYTAWIQNAAD